MSKPAAVSGAVVRDTPGPGYWVAIGAPWALLVSGFFWAGALRIAMRDDVLSWYWAALVILVNVLLTFLVWLASRARGRLTNSLATISVAAYGAWQYNAIAIPHFTWRNALVYVLLSLVIGAGNNCLVIFRGPGNGTGGPLDEMRRYVGNVKALNEVRMSDDGRRVLARVAVEPGALAADLKAEPLASLVGAPAGGARILPSPDRADEAMIEIEPVDYLKVPHIYPGPTRRGQRLTAAPALLGVRSSGRPLELHYTADPAEGRNLAQALVAGMNGAGKSEAIRILVADGMSRGPEYTYVYGNARKADQEPGWMLAGAQRVARNKQELIALLRWLRDEEAPRRAKLMGDAGFGTWTSAVYDAIGLAFLDVILDEFAAVAQDVERLSTDLGETLRSLGVRLVCAMQRPSGNRMSTDFRAQFGTHWCFGVDGPETSAMALPEEVLDEGAAPHAWGNRKPGMCYLSAPGVTDEERSEKARTFWLRDGSRLNAWGDALVRERSGDAPAPVEARSIPQDAPAPVEAIESMAAAVLREHADEPEEESMEADEEEESAVAREGIPAAEARDMLRVDRHEEIAGAGGGMPLGLDPSVMSDEAARMLARQMVEALGRSGVTTFVVGEVLTDVLVATGRSAQWLSKWLGRWCEDSEAYGPALLRRLDARGKYEFVRRVIERAA